MATSISMVKRKVATWPDCWVTSQWKSTLFWVRILCSSTKKNVFSWKIRPTAMWVFQPQLDEQHPINMVSAAFGPHLRHLWAHPTPNMQVLWPLPHGWPVRAPCFVDFLLEIYPNQRWNWWFAMICLWVSMRFPMKDKVGSTLGTLSVRDDGEHHPLVLTSGEFGPRPECWEIPRSRNPFHTHTHL